MGHKNSVKGGLSIINMRQDIRDLERRIKRLEDDTLGNIGTAISAVCAMDDGPTKNGLANELLMQIRRYRRADGLISFRSEP